LTKSSLKQWIVELILAPFQNPKARILGRGISAFAVYTCLHLSSPEFAEGMEEPTADFWASSVMPTSHSHALMFVDAPSQQPSALGTAPSKHTTASGQMLAEATADHPVPASDTQLTEAGSPKSSTGQQEQAAKPSPPDEVARGETVQNRKRKEYDPLGIHVGGFTVFPSTTLKTTIDDNIYAKPTGQRSDTVAALNADLKIQSNWNNHLLESSLGVEAKRYVRNSKENHANISFDMGGRLDIVRDVYLKAKASAKRLYEKRSSPDDANGLEPTQYDKFAFEAVYHHKLNRLTFDLTGKLTDSDYTDVASASGVVNNDDRDRLDTEGTLKASYEFKPDFSVFAETTWKKISYDDDFDDDGVNRDSIGATYKTGMRFDFSGVTFGDIYLGATSQRYADASLQKSSGAIYGGKITWNPTRLTTVTWNAERVISETTTAGASGVLDTKLDLTVDHELLRNLILTARVEKKFSNYQGISQDDEDTKLKFSAKYLINRNVNAQFTLEHHNRDAKGGTSPADREFDQSQISLGLTFQI